MTCADAPIVLDGARCNTSKENLSQVHNAKALVKACTHNNHVQGYRSPGHCALSTDQVKQTKPSHWLPLLLDSRSQAQSQKKTWWGVNIKSIKSWTVKFQQQKATGQSYLPTQGTELSLQQPFQITIFSLPLLQETGIAPPTNVLHVQIWPGGICGLSFFLVLPLL